MKLVGVIGCGGKIGKNICRYLSKDYFVKGGQRHKPVELSDLDNFTWEELDIYDKGQLNEFCKGCDMIINCAGPAYVISRTIAESSANMGVVYLDVSDALAADSGFIEKMAQSGEYIIAAGYYPGLVGMLIRSLSEHFDTIESIRGISGGDEAFTAISCIDIALSGESGYAVSDSYWENGSFHRSDEKFRLDFCEAVGKKVYIKRFISNEIAVLLNEMNIGRLDWFDISENNGAGIAAMKYYSLRDKFDMNEVIGRLSESISKMNNDSRKEWNVLDITADGQKDDEYKSIHIRLELGGTYGITALAVAEAAKAAMEKERSKGIIWANTIIPFSAIENYKKIDDSFVFSYEEEFEI